MAEQFYFVGSNCIADYDEELPSECGPVITLEVISREAERREPPPRGSDPPHAADDAGEPEPRCRSDDDSHSRSDLLEYASRRDGGVVCRLCGEILPSRTHWYRHKYKFHVAQALNPAPLYRCDRCLVYFKSRKGYMGHIASRHGGDGATQDPAASAQAPEVVITPVRADQDPPDADAAARAPTDARKHPRATRSSEPGMQRVRSPEWEARRSREEKLVADIIDRVRRECEAAGPGGGGRRGYTRRTTVMNT